MSVHDVENAQEALVPRDELEPYAGQWVALREGRVVASAHDPTTLRANPEVLPDDVLLAVSEGDTTYFL